MNSSPNKRESPPGEVENPRRGREEEKKSKPSSLLNKTPEPPRPIAKTSHNKKNPAERMKSFGGGKLITPKKRNPVAALRTGRELGRIPWRTPESPEYQTVV
jgi:hypothetical protein